MELSESTRNAYNQLKAIRDVEGFSLKLTPAIRSLIDPWGDGNLIPLRVRDYQNIGVYHLLKMKRFILGDDTGLGKTLEAILMVAYVLERAPDYRIIIVTPKSSLWQWDGEFEKFTTSLRGVVSTGPLAKREKVYNQFFSKKKDRPSYLILNYNILIRDYADYLTDSLEGSPYMVIFDEAQAFKNTKTKTHHICRDMSWRADRAYGLTATPLKNTLMDGFGIFKAIVPGLFTTKSKFYEEFCVMTLQDIPQPGGGSRKIPVVLGYKNLNRFRDRIDPFFLGRRKHQVTDELPTLTSKVQRVEMTPKEKTKYKEVMKGELILDSGDTVKTTHLTALIYWQQLVNSLSVLGMDGMSAKETELMRMMQEDVTGKVIIFSRFKRVVKRLAGMLKDIGIRSVMVHGDIKDRDREENKKLFQKIDSGVDVVFITAAGSESINLHAASTLIFYDSPWAFGEYIQILGRMIRIGSRHDKVVAIHMVAELHPKTEALKPVKKSGKKKKEHLLTIDEHVIGVLMSKQKVVEEVLGKAGPGALEFGTEGDAKNLYEMIVQNARKAG